MKPALTATACGATVLAVFCFAAGAASAASSTATAPCADPAADIELALISKSGPTTGRVRITGVVKNLGAAAWTASGPSHYLQAVLTRQDAGTRDEGEPVQPAIAIRQLAPGQQYRIDYQTDWDTRRKALPRFILRFFDSGQAVPRPADSGRDCRPGNNRKEVTAADINRLFRTAAAPPLRIENYRLLGGIGVNTVETELAYRRRSTIAGRLTASVAPPYAGTSDEVPLGGNSGTVKIRVHVPCDAPETPPANPPSVTITYRLWSTLGLPGGSGWVPDAGLEHAIPYRELCTPGPANKASP